MKAGEVFHTQGSLDLVFNVADDPGHWYIYGVYRITKGILFVIDMEKNFKLFCFGRIVIDFFLHKIVDISAIDLYCKSVLGVRQVVYRHFRQRMKAAEGNGKREEWIFAVSLLCADHMFSYGKFSELCELVEKN